MPGKCREHALRPLHKVLETDNTKVSLSPVPTVFLVSANALSVSHAYSTPSYGQLDFTRIEQVKTVGDVPKVTQLETGM